ncbi:MAG: type II secretion system F family protein [Burkholderiales bacterium]
MRIRADVVQGKGVPQTIFIDAPSLDDARRQALGLGYAVLSCKPAGVHLGELFSRSNWRPAQIDVVVFIEQLRDLLVAGLSVIEALDALRRGASGDARRLIEQLERSLRTGHTLSDALSKQSAFPALLVALVRSSELTSDLPQTLARFLEHERRVAEVRHRLVSASIYPLLLTGVGTLVLLFLFFYVMPRFARVFEGMAGELPWSAKAMVSWAAFLAQYSTALLSLVSLLTIAIVTLASASSVRAGLARAVLNWAPLKSRMTTYFLARWYRANGMLVTGGIPLPEALRLSNSLLPAALQTAGAQVERNVRDGLTPSAAHAQAGMATPIAEQLLLAGERTGDLGSVLTRIAQFHEAEVSRTLERTMRALEPLVMVAIGLGVGIVVVLMYMPIFELASSIQ